MIRRQPLTAAEAGAQTVLLNLLGFRVRVRVRVRFSVRVRVEIRVRFSV